MWCCRPRGCGYRRYTERRATDVMVAAGDAADLSCRQSLDTRIDYRMPICHQPPGASPGSDRGQEPDRIAGYRDDVTIRSGALKLVWTMHGSSSCISPFASSPSLSHFWLWRLLLELCRADQAAPLPSLRYVLGNPPDATKHKTRTRFDRWSSLASKRSLAVTFLSTSALHSGYVPLSSHDDRSLTVRRVTSCAASTRLKAAMASVDNDLRCNRIKCGTNLRYLDQAVVTTCSRECMLY